MYLHLYFHLDTFFFFRSPPLSFVPAKSSYFQGFLHVFEYSSPSFFIVRAIVSISLKCFFLSWSSIYEPFWSIM